MDYATRIQRVEPSATLAISNKAAELEADGVDIVDLGVGEPDFKTPENIVEAGKAAMDAGHHGYTSSNGIPELKDAIVDYLQSLNLEYESENLIVTPGAKQALYETIQCLINPGDEVVLLDPAWVSYEAMVKLAGGDLTRVDLSPYDFALEPALSDVEAAVSDETELLVVNTPSNPTGSLFSEAALDGVCDLAKEHDVTVVSDEIYREITFSEPPTSLATRSGMFERTVTINGFSKAYAMTGWRLGYLAAPESLIDQIGKLHSHSVTCAANFVQHAGIEALRNTDDAVDDMRAAFEDRRDMLIDLFADRGVEVPVPGGAFYMMVPVDENDTEWCERAIEEAHVAMVPGSAFGTSGYARLSYANSKERLQEAVQRLDEAGVL